MGHGPFANSSARYVDTLVGGQGLFARDELVSVAARRPINGQQVEIAQLWRGTPMTRTAYQVTPDDYTGGLGDALDEFARVHAEVTDDLAKRFPRTNDASSVRPPMGGLSGSRNPPYPPINVDWKKWHAQAQHYRIPAAAIDDPQVQRLNLAARQVREAVELSGIEPQRHNALTDLYWRKKWELQDAFRWH